MIGRALSPRDVVLFECLPITPESCPSVTRVTPRTLLLLREWFARFDFGIVSASGTTVDDDQHAVSRAAGGEVVCRAGAD